MLTVSNLSICTKRTKEVLVHSVSFSVGNGDIGVDWGERKRKKYDQQVYYETSQSPII